MAVMRLTEARIRALPLGSGIYRDENVKGLMVIAHKTTKTYAVQGDVRRNGRHVRTVRVKVDRVDRMRLAEARRRAKALMSSIQSGIDPTAVPQGSGITLSEALEAHIADRELRERTKADYRYQLDRHLRCLRNRAVADISRSEVRELFDRIERRSGKTSAAGAMRVLRALINTAKRIDETILSNPVEAVRIPVPRPRAVEPIDLRTWWTSTGTLTPVMRDIHRVTLLTGARRSSILLARRDDFDPERRTLTFTHMKTGGQLVFPTGKRLSEILNGRLKDDSPLGNRWLWPSPCSKCGHITEPKQKRLPSPHALRHYARTLMIAAGVPYAESALLLGHKLPGATGGYVHPEHLVEALRPHAQAFEDHVFALTDKLKANNG